ncbi:cytochrome-c peroxidase [Pseudomonas sp. PB120]|nr:cytochrome-c peroxidase [Pseudomonas sp. PB120]
MAPLPARAPSPSDNPFTEAKAVLGERLFNDPKLSRSGQIACASCHEPDEAFADGRRVSFGHDRQTGRRNAPSVVMSGFTRHLFWDGRSPSLEAQAVVPIADHVEMAFTTDELLTRLNNDAEYPKLFEQTFALKGPIVAEQIAQALATYQRTLVKATRNTAFEQLLLGRPQRMSDQQLYGLHLFRTQARCMNCHFGPTLSDDQFHNLGLTYYGRKYEDLGRYEVTANPQDVGAFRTPSLRLLSKTAPWMHNGLFVNMEGTIAFYNQGMPRPEPVGPQKNDPLFPRTSDRLKPLGLDLEQRRALIEFLDSL